MTTIDGLFTFLNSRSARGCYRKKIKLMNHVSKLRSPIWIVSLKNTCITKLNIKIRLSTFFLWFLTSDQRPIACLKNTPICRIFIILIISAYIHRVIEKFVLVNTVCNPHCCTLTYTNVVLFNALFREK